MRAVALFTLHGNDFTPIGPEANAKWMDAKLRSKFELKTNIPGPGGGHSKQLMIVNTIISREGDGMAP